MATLQEEIQDVPNSTESFMLTVPEPRSPDSLPSPITELTECFTGLTAFYPGDTPRRRLDLSNISTESAEAAALTSPKQETHTDKAVSHALPPDCTVPRNSRMQRFRSFLPNLLCSSPKEQSFARAQHSLPKGNKENVAVVGRHSKAEDATMRLLDSHQLSSPEPFALGSPIFPPPHFLGDREADGFMEVTEDQEESLAGAGMSSSMAQLLSDPLMNQEVDLSSVSVRHRGARRLFRSPSMPERLNRAVLKRPPRSPATKAPFKRHRTMPAVSEGEHEECEPAAVESKRQRCLLKKTLSLCEVAHQLGGDNVSADLIGDFSKVYALPTVSGKHQDLKYITGETMFALLNGEFSSLVESFVVVDCRYPYEFQGGHIKGALNLPNTDEAVAHLLRQRMRARCPKKRLLLVFHCEFSSERAPRTCHLLRRDDRSMNEYPHLYYPELYVLKGGYRDFFRAYTEYCEPQSYCPMHHEDHREELLRFRSHSRACAEDRRRRQHVTRLIKL